MKVKRTEEGSGERGVRRIPRGQQNGEWISTHRLATRWRASFLSRSINTEHIPHAVSKLSPRQLLFKDSPSSLSSLSVYTSPSLFLSRSLGLFTLSLSPLFFGCIYIYKNMCIFFPLYYSLYKNMNTFTMSNCEMIFLQHIYIYVYFIYI